MDRLVNGTMVRSLGIPCPNNNIGDDLWYHSGSTNSQWLVSREHSDFATTRSSYDFPSFFLCHFSDGKELEYLGGLRETYPFGLWVWHFGTVAL